MTKNALSIFRAIAKRAGLVPMRLHGFRHLHATHLRETGADGFLIATGLGHAERIVPDTVSTQPAILSTQRRSESAKPRSLAASA